MLTEVATNARPIEGVPTTTGATRARSPLDHLEQLPSLADRLGHAETSIRPDTDYKYVSIRRYVAQLEESIQNALQFAVFEPNGEALWATARATVSDFLLNEWHNGALRGAKPEEAFFVKCDRSTMTQDDIDNGRMVMVIGVATLKPAEFVVVRISTATASSKP